jgi:hypothetical protein
MLRGIAGVIVGFIALFIFTFVCLTIAYFALGNDRVFEAGNFNASLIWLVSMLLVSLVAALIGGYVCAAISGGGKAPLGLAIVLLVLGLLGSVMVIMSPKPVLVRAPDVAMMEAMQNARQPVWHLLIGPFLQAIFVMIGARVKKRDA